jgi:trimethylamine-N-oxide reductase (cytochrome c) cytochrome c-type subunit TorY
MAFPVVSVVSLHEISVRHFQDVLCVGCHEMKEPIGKWRESGAAANHTDCVGCHFDRGIRGWIAAYESAAVQVVEHFRRDPAEPLRPPEEPLLLADGEEPGYWSLVPNRRCFQCHDARNHKASDQARIHAGVVKNIARQPCKDCHNHEMTNGRKFHQPILAARARGAVTRDQN